MTVISPPFHRGECAIQARVGVREKIKLSGVRGIRDYMPDQHREFFAQLPLLFLSSSDARERPWASVLIGQPGFVQSPDKKTLRVTVKPIPGDPLISNLHDGSAVGGLGIEFHSRRRNRVNGKVGMSHGGDGFTIHVDQSFGNCPKYIQARQLRFPPTELPSSRIRPIRYLDRLDGRSSALLTRSDTFFIASQHGVNPSDRSHGLDLSHRGGRPGFVQLQNDGALVWSDYRGNSFFNTLGNIELDPRCGLLFIDFSNGDTLQLSGRAEIVWD
jgi:uncharacterized protein